MGYSTACLQTSAAAYASLGVNGETLQFHLDCYNEPPPFRRGFNCHRHRQAGRRCRRRRRSRLQRLHHRPPATAVPVAAAWIAASIAAPPLLAAAIIAAYHPGRCAGIAAAHRRRRRPSHRLRATHPGSRLTHLGATPPPLAPPTPPPGAAQDTARHRRCRRARHSRQCSRLTARGVRHHRLWLAVAAGRPQRRLCRHRKRRRRLPFSPAPSYLPHAPADGRCPPPPPRRTAFTLR